MREKTNGFAKERRQIISLLLAGFSLYFIYFYSVAELQSSLSCWRCLILTSSRCDPGNRVGWCCVYGFVTAGFKKMKLLVQTAAPLTAPAKSNAGGEGVWGGGDMLHCLDLNHFFHLMEVRLTLELHLYPYQGCCPARQGLGWKMGGGVGGWRQQMPHLSPQCNFYF